MAPAVDTVPALQHPATQPVNVKTNQASGIAAEPQRQQQQQQQQQQQVQVVQPLMVTQQAQDSAAAASTDGRKSAHLTHLVMTSLDAGSIPDRSSPPAGNSLLPTDFEWAAYLALNPDLPQNGIMSEAAATEHYTRQGRKERRAYRPIFNNQNVYATA